MVEMRSESSNLVDPDEEIRASNEFFTSNLDEQDRVSFFYSIYERFEQAQQIEGEPVDKYYRIGEDVIRLRFAGSALVPHFTPAFAHLETIAMSSPALTICLWDSVSTHTEMPLLVRNLIDLLIFRWYERLDTRREIKGFHSHRIRTLFHFGPNILSLMDTSRNVAIYWLNDAAATPYYEKGYPFTTIFNWWMEQQQRQCVHAAAVGNKTGGVLLPGKSGSGKSTTSLACLDSELSYVSDDTSLISCERGPCVYSLYNTAKVEHFHHLPHLKSYVSNAVREQNEKGMIFLHQYFPDKIISGFPLKGILVPRIAGGKTTHIKPTSPGKALKALAPSTLLQLPGAGVRAFRLMSQLVKSVPCYQLDLGTDMHEIPKVISTFLQDHATVDT